MPGRCPHLNDTALPMAVMVVLALPGACSAHRLEAEYQVLAGKRIQIESWFDLTGESARGAKVKVYGAEAALLTEGELDEQGTFVFSISHSGPLTVTISTAGHSKKLVIPQEALADVGRAAPTPGPFADRSPRVTYADVLSGVALVLALASFVLSLRTARRLREIQRNTESSRRNADRP